MGLNTKDQSLCEKTNTVSITRALVFLDLIWMSIGFIVLMAKKGPIQKTFYVTGVASVLSIAYLLNSTKYCATNMIVQRFYQLFLPLRWTFGMSFFPFLIMYFFWIFPRPFKFIQHKWVKRVFWGIPVVVIDNAMEFLQYISVRSKDEKCQYVF